jgi:ArsR family transcriptional regulator, lead/cadmium/zinc/bismuth-responsive transcriptional repressor
VSEDRCDLLCLDLPAAERLRQRRLASVRAQSAAARAQGLADPTRLTLAAALLDADELCVCDLAWIVERSQGLVSHHVRALRANGLVGSRREGKMVMYALTEEGRTLVTSVLSVAVARA